MGGGGMSGFMTGRSTANLLTRTTAILAAAFMTTSVLLVVLHNRQHAPVSIIDQGGPAVPASRWRRQLRAPPRGDPPPPPSAPLAH